MTRLLFVCLGNICRSPSAQGVVQHLLEGRGWSADYDLDSAGTAAYHIGEAPDRRSIFAAQQRGIDLSGQRARIVEDGDFEAFDYILAMDDSNRADLLRRAPADRAHRILQMMAFAPDTGYPEVPDPYYGGPDGFERVLDLLTLAGNGLLDHIGSSGD